MNRNFIDLLYAKAVKLDSGVLAVDLWREVVRLAEKYTVALEGKRAVYDALTLEFLQDISKVDEKLWKDMCEGIGWTPYGAVALSWCRNARLDEVWKGWLASGFPLKPLPEFERPARFINPALMPQMSKLSSIVDMSAGNFTDKPDLYSLAISATIVAQNHPFEFDMVPENLAKAPPQVAAILKSRLLRKPEQTSEDKAIIETWDKLIKGTEWDVWNKEVK